MALFFSRDSQGGVPKLSRFGLPGLWAFITSRPELGSGRGLNQSCSSPWDLSNAMSHSRCRRRKEVDSRLLVVGSQTASLTPGPSFAHNLGCKWPMRGQFRHLHFKTFRMTPITPQCEVFWPFNSSSEFLGVSEDSKFPLLGVWASPSHLAQSGVATTRVLCSCCTCCCHKTCDTYASLVDWLLLVSLSLGFHLHT
jgi:hypothetical protein